MEDVTPDASLEDDLAAMLATPGTSDELSLISAALEAEDARGVADSVEAVKERARNGECILRRAEKLAAEMAAASEAAQSRVAIARSAVSAAVLEEAQAVDALRKHHEAHVTAAQVAAMAKANFLGAQRAKEDFELKMSTQSMLTQLEGGFRACMGLTDARPSEATENILPQNLSRGARPEAPARAAQGQRASKDMRKTTPARLHGQSAGGRGVAAVGGRNQLEVPDDAKQVPAPAHDGHVATDDVPVRTPARAERQLPSTNSHAGSASEQAGAQRAAPTIDAGCWANSGQPQRPTTADMQQTSTPARARQLVPRTPGRSAGSAHAPCSDLNTALHGSQPSLDAACQADAGKLCRTPAKVQTSLPSTPGRVGRPPRTTARPAGLMHPLVSEAQLAVQGPAQIADVNHGAFDGQQLAQAETAMRLERTERPPQLAPQTLRETAQSLPEPSLDFSDGNGSAEARQRISMLEAKKKAAIEREDFLEASRLNLELDDAMIAAKLLEEEESAAHKGRDRHDRETTADGEQLTVKRKRPKPRRLSQFGRRPVCGGTGMSVHQDAKLAPSPAKASPSALRAMRGRGRGGKAGRQKGGPAPKEETVPPAPASDRPGGNCESDGDQNSVAEFLRATAEGGDAGAEFQRHKKAVAKRKAKPGVGTSPKKRRLEQSRPAGTLGLSSPGTPPAISRLSPGHAGGA